ncbi:MAG: outer-membrane lipoprotein carrier protein LolA [Sphingomonadales bacterium]|jgi:outer membrane lipoprotein-sorting protein
MILRTLPLLALLAALPAGATTLADVAASLKATTSMAADFAQAGADGKQVAGKMWLSRPGRMRFQYANGEQLIVADGRLLSFIDYRVNQVSQWPVRKTPLQILLASDPDLSALAKVVADTPAGVLVEARDPKRPDFGTISLAFRRDASAPAGLALAGWSTADAQGGRSDVRLSNVRYNAALAPKLFTFNDPRPPSQR